MSNYSRLDTLRGMLSYRRPMGSSSERAFIRRYVSCLPGADRDPAGNWHVQIGTSDIVWSAHTDTVHVRDGRQHVNYDGRHLSLGLRTARKSNCLGADDTAGCFLLCEMIRAGVPGHYVFHYGEERGGVGSNAITHTHPDLFTGTRAVIAFDRRGTSDVITHQAGDRCCSDVFAASLARILGGTYAPCDAGIFTDSANYTELVGECTNVSVGYAREHTTAETLDTWHLFTLLDTLLAADFSSLEYARQPGEPDPDYADMTWAFYRSTRRSDLFAPGTEDAVCEECGIPYHALASPARSWPDYCSEECEELARLARTNHGLYLASDHGRIAGREYCTCTVDCDGDIMIPCPDCPVHLDRT